MKRRRLRKIIILVLLCLLLAFLGIWYANYRATRSLRLDFVKTATDSVTPPTYMYMFNGAGSALLKRPVGILAASGSVYVTDSTQAQVYRFSTEGKLLGTFGKGRLVTPLYMAQHPRTQEIYVSDRGTHAIQVFTAEGKWVRTFQPNLPKDQIAKTAPKGVVWMPVALGFAPDGSLYVTELLKGHRLVKFGPDGRFQGSVGTAGLVNKATENPTWFEFPNSVKVHDGAVWVVDSNNRRIQVFTPDLKYERLIDTGGLPRGMDFLAMKSRNGTSTPSRFAAIDTLAHDGTIWNTKGESLANFGQQGILEGQFNFPNDVSVGPKNLLFVTDTLNGRVQVWGWPSEVSPIPTVTVPQNWWLCLTPLLLLPLLLLRRKRRFFATADFVEDMIAREAADTLSSPRWYWAIAEEEYARIKDLRQDDLLMGTLFEPSEHSESDARALVERLELAPQAAIVLSLAQRARVFCTNDPELRRYAKVLDVDVVNSEEYLRRFAKQPSQADRGPAE